jgi:hypothetical protein
MLKQDSGLVLVILDSFETLPEFYQRPDGVGADCLPSRRHAHLPFRTIEDSDHNLAAGEDSLNCFFRGY